MLRFVKVRMDGPGSYKISAETRRALVVARRCDVVSDCLLSTRTSMGDRF